jgi:hypothetical protein
MKSPSLPFNVQERDIDLLILEQLHTSPSFVSWIAAKIGISDGTFVDAMHSVFRDGGETDVMLFLDTPEGRVAVMIEDKIGAQMQPRQGERYHERGEVLCREGKAVRYVTVLCAPEIYLSGISELSAWQHRLPIEDLGRWFSSDVSPSAIWRSSILTAAASKGARARHADDRSNTQFDGPLLALKADYQKFVEGHYDELIATLQTGRDREYYLRARRLPAGIRFKHSFFRGEISLIFERKWAEVAARHLDATLPDRSWLVRHGGELHLRMPVDVFDPALPLSMQEDTAKKALDEICLLIPVAENILILSSAVPKG